MIFKGLYTALVTPFDKQNNIHVESFKNLLNLQLKSQVAGVVPLGTTGESPTISKEEKKLIIKTTVEILKGKLPIIVGTGSYSTEQTIENTLQAESEGADAALIVTPYYNKPTSEGIFKHFEAVSKSTKLPIIVYNIQGRSAKNIDTPTLKRLSDLPNIKAVKEASGNIEQMVEVLDTVTHHRPDFTVLSGDDSLTLPLIALGGHGVISVVSNLVPKQMNDLVLSALKGDFETARQIHFKLLKLFKTAFIETNPIPIKAAMNLCGLDVGGYRLPLCDMEPKNFEVLSNVVKKMELL
jgi:4-hydroxy-tetrahydrodipicolinate synthase